MLDNPGPSEYIPDQTKDLNTSRMGGETKPFGVNTMRFKTIDHQVPGAGTYKLPDSCKVREEKMPHASNRSTVEKGLDQVIGKLNPGIGEYDTQHLKTIANKEFQGGASNNFVLFTRKNFQARNP